MIPLRHVSRIACCLLSCTLWSAGGPAHADAVQAGSSAAALAPVGLGDYFRVDRARDPRISPDGRRVAYVRVSPDVATDSWRSTLRMVDVATMRDVPLIAPALDGFQPRWSPDGQSLAFVRIGAGGLELAVAEPADAGASGVRGVKVLTKLPAAPFELAWSPDGTQLAFIARLDSPLRTPVAAAPPAGARWSAPPHIYDWGGFQQLNQMLPATGDDYALFVVGSRNGAMRRVTAAGALGRSFPFMPAGLAWAPDGRRVLTSLQPGRDAFLNVIQGLLYSIDVQSGSIAKVAGEEGGAYFSPSFGSDGAMGFGCRTPSRNNLLRFEYCWGASEAGPFRSLAPEIDSMILPAVLAPDGSGFFGVYGERAVAYVTWFGLDGRRERLAATGGGDADAYLSGGAISVANDGTVAFLFSDARTPSEVAVVRRGSPPRVITRLNADLMARRQISRVSEVTYTPTDGALDVHAFLFHPTRTVAARRPPGIVVLHGGQSSDYGPDFDLMPQVMAAHGYLVILPNYRGSGTYGRAFANSVSGLPLDREFDVLGAADALVQAGADPERLYVMGGSGGGLITAWTITRTSRFRAAVVWYGLSEWWAYSMEAATGPSSIQTFRNTPWDDPSEYISRSPYAHLGRVSTPTMVIAGADDRITPLSGSISLFRGLQVRGVPSELVVYPGEAHGIDGTPSHLMGHIAETLGWLAREGGESIVPPDLPTPRREAEGR
jgi:dipeptidyl aminopeptidase/acylaminoacyl peptidase